MVVHYWSLEHTFYKVEPSSKPSQTGLGRGRVAFLVVDLLSCGQVVSVGQARLLLV